jgi:hypothetical protein
MVRFLKRIHNSYNAPLKTGIPRYSRTFYLQMRLFTLAKMFQIGNLDS